MKVNSLADVVGVLLLALLCVLPASAQSLPTDSIESNIGLFDIVDTEHIPAYQDNILTEINPHGDGNFAVRWFNNPNNVPYAPYRFKVNQLIAPAALIVAGSIGVNCFKNFKWTEREWFADMRNGQYLHFDDYIQYLPALGYLGLGMCGVKSRGDLLDRIGGAATAYIFVAIATNTIKYTVGEMRPNLSPNHNSFPSGHSAVAFCGAELMRLEYGNLVGIGGYAVAITTGFMRMYNNKHWYNDILAGAGVGILSARAAYWLLPWERKVLKRTAPTLSKRVETAAILPAYDHSTRTASLSLALTLR